MENVEGSNMSWRVKDVLIGLCIGAAILAVPELWWLVGLLLVGYIMGAS